MLIHLELYQTSEQLRLLQPLPHLMFAHLSRD